MFGNSIRQVHSPAIRPHSSGALKRYVKVFWIKKLLNFFDFKSKKSEADLVQDVRSSECFSNLPKSCYSRKSWLMETVIPPNCDRGRKELCALREPDQFYVNLCNLRMNLNSGNLNEVVVKNNCVYASIFGSDFKPKPDKFRGARVLIGPHCGEDHRADYLDTR